MSEVVRMEGVSLVRDGNSVLRDVSWVVNSGDRWVVVGPNGAGKTSLLSVAAARVNPTSGTVVVLDGKLGEADTLETRIRVGLSSEALADLIADNAVVSDVVMTAAHGITDRQREAYEAVDERRAADLLAAFGMQDFAGRQFGTLSEGERKRVQIARSLMADPEIVLLDEPAAGLDLAGREELLAALTELAGDARSPVLVMVTHHVEEIPSGFTHALVLEAGAVVAAGPLRETLTSATLSRAYGISVILTETDGRWAARKAL